MTDAFLLHDFTGQPAPPMGLGLGANSPDGTWRFEAGVMGRDAGIQVILKTVRTESNRVWHILFFFQQWIFYFIIGYQIEKNAVTFGKDWGQNRNFF